MIPLQSALRLSSKLLGQKGASFTDRAMRLLNTSTFELEEFFEPENVVDEESLSDEGNRSDERKIPRYAILSHRWGDEEITFQELQQKDVTVLLKSTKMQVVNGEPLHCLQNVKKGFSKIIGCALQAEKDGFEYIWCDTCCINKTDSTELSEAINSMYDWYKDQRCYAYLTDVPHAGYPVSTEKGSAFAESEGFQR